VKEGKAKKKTCMNLTRQVGRMPIGAEAADLAWKGKEAI